MTGTNDEARAFNLYLKTLEQQVYDAHRQLIDGNVPVTVQSLKDKLFGKAIIPEAQTLVPIFKEHNRRIKALVPLRYAHNLDKFLQFSFSKHQSKFDRTSFGRWNFWPCH